MNTVVKHCTTMPEVRAQIDALDARIVRVAAPDCPVPFSAPLEDAFLPQPNQMVEQAKSLFGKSFS